MKLQNPLKKTICAENSLSAGISSRCKSPFKPIHPPFNQFKSPSKQLEIIQLIPILHDIPLDLASHRPGHKVLHAPRNQICCICYCLSTHTHMPLLHHFRRRLHCFRHPQPCHEHWESSSRKSADCDAVLDGGELGGRRENAHVVELIEKELFLFSAHGVVWR